MHVISFAVELFHLGLEIRAEISANLFKSLRMRVREAGEVYPQALVSAARVPESGVILESQMAHDQEAPDFSRGRLYRLSPPAQRQGTIAPIPRRLARAPFAQALRLPLVATNDVGHAGAERALLDVLTCIRLHTTLEEAGRRLWVNNQRHLKPPAEMAMLFRDLPRAVAATREIAERCSFTLSDLGYRFPDYPVPPG